MEKIWIKNYPNNIPPEISQSKHNSLQDLFYETTELFSKKTAFRNFNSSITFDDTKKYSEKFASYLQNNLKIKKGTKVAIMLPNLMTYPVVLFGSFIAGAIVINVNPLFKQRELLDVLHDSEPEIIIVLDKFLNELEPVINKTKLRHIIVCSVTDLLNPIMKLLIKSVLFMKGETVTLKNNMIRFKDTIKNKFALEKVSIGRDDIAFLQYTGGTTGKSKAAVLTHNNLLSNIDQVYIWIKSYVSEGKEIILTALPLYHIFSLTVNCLTFFKLGAENLLITNPRDIKRFVNTLEKNKFTVVTGVNTLFNLLISNSNFKKIDFKKLKFAVGGGMAVLKDTAEKWKEITGTHIIQGYGLTETSPVIAINIITDKYNGFIGLPMPSTEISIRNDNEKELQIDNEGELCVKGPQVMTEYWNSKEETKIAFTKDGYFKTGDIAKINEDGFLKIVDRKKDMIISSGFNVYPGEIEDYVTRHPDILEAGVIGITDKNRGESIKLFIVTNNPNLKKGEVISFCKKGLTIYKIPKYIEFIKELPKNNVGKILRRKLREI